MRKIPNKIVSLILKGLLLYGTAFFTIIFMLCLEQIIVEGHWVVLTIYMVSIFVLLGLCQQNISVRELYILSGQSLINKWLK